MRSYHHYCMINGLLRCEAACTHGFLLLRCHHYCTVKGFPGYEISCILDAFWKPSQNLWILGFLGFSDSWVIDFLALDMWFWVIYLKPLPTSLSPKILSIKMHLDWDHLYQHRGFYCVLFSAFMSHRLFHALSQLIPVL